MPMLTIAPRFCGPPGTANGGYASGMLAQHARQTVRVRLLRPVPLGTPLQVEVRDGGRLEMLHEGGLIASAEPAELALVVPRPPEYLAALEASRRYVGFSDHAFPGCFVCGPERARGDGLRIFAGPWSAGPESDTAGAAAPVVAAPWVPSTALGLADGKVRPEFMWAALDCPGYFAARADRVAMLLGEFTAHVDRRVHVDEPCVVIGWRIGVSGRKYEVGTALFDEDGELCARARALWIEPRTPTVSAVT
ncbi:MAG TPA: hypothetical protein VK130_06100 [Steroidobacteraceae bacterium]|nr:hypothetical protein [Steroidobacteraceae bacterium]